MKKDNPQLKVEDIAVAIAPRNDPHEELWDVYLINLKEEPIKNVLVTSNGNGEMDGEEVKTTTLRYFFDEVDSLGYVVVEPIQSRLFRISNEYWISFNLNDYMFDKRYVFVNGSIDTAHFTTIPFIGKKGVMIR